MSTALCTGIAKDKNISYRWIFPTNRTELQHHKLKLPKNLTESILFKKLAHSTTCQFQLSSTPRTLYFRLRLRYLNKLVPSAKEKRYELDHLLSVLQTTPVGRDYCRIAKPAGKVLITVSNRVGVAKPLCRKDYDNLRVSFTWLKNVSVEAETYGRKT